jgi:hypothetical protein
MVLLYLKTKNIIEGKSAALLIVRSKKEAKAEE